MWDYFKYVIPLLGKDYHLIIPALPGYDPEITSNFTSVEEIAKELESWLGAQEMGHCIYQEGISWYTLCKI